MGLGPPVDTTAPTLFIITPENNSFLDGVIINAPINLYGNWFDDVGITSLSFDVYNRTDSEKQDIKNIKYTIIPDGTWTASFVIDSNHDSDKEYDITVTARDKFNNKGANTVRVRIEIVPPWIESHQITRHPGTSWGGFSDNLYTQVHYNSLNYEASDADRNIPYENIDQFQNEGFTLKVDIVQSFSGLAASRLIIMNDRGEPLITDDPGIEPDRYTGGLLRRPEWDIPASSMAILGEGPHFIQFQILAWGQASWDSDNNIPKPDAPYRRQMCMTNANTENAGTVWYNQSDRPKISLNAADMLGDILTLAPDRDNQLRLKFYDDDRIDEVYAGLLTKNAFDTLRGGVSEDAYLMSLETDATARDNAKIALNTAISGSGNNRFVSNENYRDRLQEVSLGTGGEGEYRLIAFVKEYKPAGQGYTFTSTTERWTSFPLLRIQVQNMDVPLIIIESPERENVFPTLTEGDGEGFRMKGYILDSMGAQSLQIAWAPTVEGITGATQEQLRQAINEVHIGGGTPITGAQSGGKIVRIGNYDITVWDVTLDLLPTPIILNNQNYYRSNFDQYFHIVDDFLRGTGGGNGQIQEGSSANLANKSFTILARKSDTNTSTSSRTFRISGNTAGPNVEVTSHGRGSNHDRDKDLELRMKVSPGQGGVKIRDGSARIYDSITGDNLFDIDTLVSGSEYYRTISSAKIKINYEEGTKRTYIFEAYNILGVRTFHERDIIMSNRPILESITCSNGDGTYGIGTVLKFEATFSMPVQVPNIYLDAARPALRLYTSPTANANPTVYRQAQFESASGSTAVFTYTVAENDLAVKLYTETCAEGANTATIDRLFTNHNSIRSSTNDTAVFIIDDANSLQNKANIGLDGVRPVVERAAFVQNPGHEGFSFFNNGKNITIKLYMSKQVQVSGTPAARISIGGIQTAANILTAEFSSMAKEYTIANPPVEKNVLYFTHTLSNTANNIALSQLSLATQNFAAFTSGVDITDIYGNSLSTSNNLTTAAMIDGSAVTNQYNSQRAYVKTTIPAAPTFTLHPTSANAGNNANAVTGDDIRRNTSVFLRVNGVVTDTIAGTITHSGGRYSLYGGNNSMAIAANTYPEIADANLADRFNENTYMPSQYSITAWQVDVAGNSSNMAPARNVTIKSRWPDLRNIDFGVPDGAYKRGSVLPIKINMSDAVSLGTNPSVTLTITGTSAGATGTVTISTLAVTAEAGSSMLTGNWTVPATGNPTVNMKDIKLQSITFTNINDEYGNALRAYSGTVAESSTNTNRPISNALAFQFARPNVEIIPNRPSITNTGKVPAVGTGENLNGYILNGNLFTLDFDVNVNAVAGNNIVIRPYGTYAIPPVLSINEFDSLLNADFRTFASANDTVGTSDTTNRTTYQRRLTDVDANGIPNSGSERGSEWNLYTKSTHGLTSGSAGNVRPDTSTKMVLDFQTDLYTGTNATNVRTILTAARWKWQMISVTSSYVSISNNIVTVTIPETLGEGRNWEVIVPDGAFQDMAANASQPVNAGTFRFWSQGTAAPVIRTEKISYDANNFGSTSHPNVALGFVNANNYPLRPPVDTRVRIDCETPGATIKYNLIRTSYSFNVNGAVFTDTSATDAAFFGADYTQGGTTVGYTKNNLGNADVAAGNRDSEGFFSGLLVPRTVQTPATGAPALSNGTVAISNLNTLGSNIRSNFDSNGITYRTVAAATGAESFNFYTTGTNVRYMYVGDAYATGTTAPANITATGAGPAIVTASMTNPDTHASLYTGRRDYIIAVARKNQVTANGTNNGVLAGPVLTVSEAGREGVFKTNLLYRQPRRSYTVGGTTTANANLTRFLVQGFDQPVIPVVAGFPLRDADSTNSNSDAFNNYFSKSAYRLGSHDTNISYTTTPAAANSHYIWVSWEIVTDWYQKAKGFSMNLTGNYMNNAGNNANSVAAPYGGVIYRYQQGFYN